MRADTNSFLERIPVRGREGFWIIPVEDLVSVVAHREYLHLRTRDGGTHIILHPLKDLHARLDPARFIRVSRSTLVNVSFVRQIVPAANGLLTISLSNGDRHEASRRRARELRDQLLRI